MEEQQGKQNKSGKTGLGRLRNAFFCSIAGMKAAWNNEAAFRQELFLFVFLFPVAFFLGENGVEKGMMAGCLLLVLIVELLNTAVEAVVDRISSQHHALSGLAKDLGSASVTLALINCVVIWSCILFL